MSGEAGKNHETRHGRVLVIRLESEENLMIASPPFHARRHILIAMNGTKKWVLAATVITALGLLAFGLTRDPYVLPSPLLDLPAPEFALRVMPDSPTAEDGATGRKTTIRLSEQRGSVVVVNYWASWCTACREEHPALSRAATRYRERGVRFFGILFQDTPGNARRFIREMGGQAYPTLLDPGSETAIEYGVYGVPETFFIDREGRIRFKQIGPVTDDLLGEKIEALLSDSTVTRPSGPGRLH
ncbi:MAG: TlpA family protein disulfide reductase [Gemmatimonadota bacterium]